MTEFTDENGIKNYVIVPWKTNQIIRSGDMLQFKKYFPKNKPLNLLDTKDLNTIFLFRGPLRFRRNLRGRPSFQIPGPLRFQRNLRGRPFLRFLVLFSFGKKANFFLFLVLFLSEKGRVFPELRKIFFPSHLWLGEKNASRGKYRKRKKYRNRKERQGFSRAMNGSEKNT